VLQGAAVAANESETNNDAEFGVTVSYEALPVLLALKDVSYSAFISLKPYYCNSDYLLL